MKESVDLRAISEFSHYLFGLKNILRFRGMPGFENVDVDRWDSVSEHSHRMALLAIMLEEYLDENNKVDLKKTLEMVLVHDVVELVANDYSPIGGKNGGHAFNASAFQDKYDRETAAAKSIFSQLPEHLSRKFTELFQSYIDTKAKPSSATNEGKFAYALDKIEAFIQVMDWHMKEKNWPRDHYEKSVRYMEEWVVYDSGLTDFSKILINQARTLSF